MINRFVLPSIMPSRKILSVDIGGTLTKAAFYLPNDDPIRQNLGKFEALTSDCIPSKCPFSRKLTSDRNTYSRAC